MAINGEFAFTDDMKRVVEEQRLGFVATVCADGTPNLSPKGTTRIWDDHRLVFADIRSPQTISNLRINPWAEVNVVDAFARRGYRFKGVCRILEEDEFADALRFYMAGDRAVANASERILNIVLIDVVRAAPITSPSYDAGASEQELREKWTRYFQSIDPGV